MNVLAPRALSSLYYLVVWIASRTHGSSFHSKRLKLTYIKINLTHMKSNSTEVLLVFGQKLTISVTVTVCTNAPVTFRSFFRHLGWWIGPNADHLLMSTLHTHTYYSWRVWIWNEPSSDALLEQWCERRILFFPKSQPCPLVLWCYPWV